MTERTKANRLDTTTTIGLTDFIRAKWDAIVAEKWTQIRTAAEASAALGKTINAGNVATIVAGLDKTWPNHRKRAGGDESKISVDDLARCVARLFYETGRPLPNILSPYDVVKPATTQPELLLKVDLPERQGDLLTHMLGAGADVPVERHGYRNMFCNMFCTGIPSEDHDEMIRMADAGLVTAGSIINNGTAQYFHATRAGCEAIGLTEAEIDRALKERKERKE